MADMTATRAGLGLTLLYAAIWTPPALVVFTHGGTNAGDAFLLTVIWAFFFALPCGLVAGWLMKRVEQREKKKRHPGRFVWLLVGPLMLTGAQFVLLLPVMLVAIARGDVVVSLLALFTLVGCCGLSALAIRQLNRRNFEGLFADERNQSTFPMSSRTMFSLMVGWAAWVPGGIVAMELNEQGMAPTVFWMGVTLVLALVCGRAYLAAGGQRHSAARADMAASVLVATWIVPWLLLVLAANGTDAVWLFLFCGAVVLVGTSWVSVSAKRRLAGYSPG
jgi:hypothetical protein